MVGKLAAEYGCQQVLWLSGEDQKLTEVGAMNIFVYWKNENGGNLHLIKKMEKYLISKKPIENTQMILKVQWFVLDSKSMDR